MNNEKSKAHVPAQKTSGLHNDFSEQEETMTNSAMPPQFGLTASGAENNPGNAKAGEAKAAPKTKLQIAGAPVELVALLEHHEGIKYKVYDDGYGNITGGLGHLLTESEKTKFPVDAALTKEQVEYWAKSDVDEAWKAGQRQAAELGIESHDFKIALASMSFQNGSYWFKTHKATWELMKAHKWEAAAVEAADSDWARQTPPRLADFQNALRKLSEGQGRNIADPFRKKSAEAKVMAKHKQNTIKPPSPKPESMKTAMPEGKEGIQQVQTKLKEMGLYQGKIDGIATSSNGESATERGIKQFQKDKSLPVTGTVDEATWNALIGYSNGSIWTRFMAKMEKERKEKSKQPKPEKGWGSEPRGTVDDPIVEWLTREIDETDIASKNSSYASIIIDAEALMLATFNNEGSGNTESGLGGTEDTFVKIRDGEPIGNGKSYKGGATYFDPKTQNVPILPVIVEILRGTVKDWVANGRQGKPNRIVLGSFMIWNSNGEHAGKLRNSNHGEKAKAIDFNGTAEKGSGNMSFDTPEAEDLVLSILKHLPVGTYEIGIPFQGVFFKSSDFGGKHHTSKASDGSWAYTKIISDKIRGQIETMLDNGCQLKVISDYNNHLHLGIGSGGDGYFKK